MPLPNTAFSRSLSATGISFCSSFAVREASSLFRQITAMVSKPFSCQSRQIPAQALSIPLRLSAFLICTGSP